MASMGGFPGQTRTLRQQILPWTAHLFDAALSRRAGLDARALDLVRLPAQPTTEIGERQCSMP